MSAKLLEGKPIAEKIKTAIASEAASLKARHGRAPKLVCVQIGENAYSAAYIASQKKAAEAVGIAYALKTLPQGASQGEAESLVAALNQDASVTAVILQMPVPRGIDSRRLSAAIAPDKDAEGMHPRNLGKIVSGSYIIGPCTAMAVMELLESSGVKLYGKEAVVVGHSDIVGKPIALMLLNKFATTTVCHIATGERGVLPEHVKRAEILVVAVGKAGIVKGDWVKPGAIVIDVGMSRVGDRMVGDVEFDAASQRASLITPVPGGVGPLTTAMLMRNTVELFKVSNQVRP